MGKQFKASSKLTAKFLVVLMVLQAVLFSLTAFGADTTLEIGDSKKAPISEPISLITKGTSALTAIFTPTNATYKAEWKSSDTAVVSVTATGAVKAGTKAGSATITAAYSALSLTDSITFNVYAPIASFKFPTTVLTIKAGQTAAMPLPLELLPADAVVTDTVYKITLPTKSELIPITINSATGVISTVDAVYGKATVEVTKFYQGIGDATKNFKKATFQVNVPVPVASLAISTDGGKNPAGDASGVNLGVKTTLKPIFNGGAKTLPSNVKVKWTSSDKVNVPVGEDTGIIDLSKVADSAKGATATITATADDSLFDASATIVLTVAKPLKAVSVTKSVYLLKKDDVKQIIPILTSATKGVDPSVVSVTYIPEANKEAIVTVSTDGVITAKGTGGPVKITVKATAADGTSKTTIVTVTVVADVKDIKLTSPTASAEKALKLYSKATIKTTVDPSGLKLNAVRFTSADTNIAFVNPYTGEVTATGVGSTTITASADGFTSEPITIYVADPDGLQQ